MLCNVCLYNHHCILRFISTDSNLLQITIMVSTTCIHTYYTKDNNYAVLLTTLPFLV